MITLEDKSSAVLDKIKELCQAVVDQESFAALKGSIDAYAKDAESQQQYAELTQMQQGLGQKQQMGQPLEDAEINDFEAKREAFFANPIAKGFIDAQQSLHTIQDEVTKYLQTTFELGHVPSESELPQAGGGCCGGGGGEGGGCGCG